ncbi:GNAT family N-acetyltransferase [Actinoplanes awajinensis]|uniref:Acetyltransferase n=1 Tax=Actinoplanes awajinensis subsp. mycoplanecinus TaxID=135947 RepID=A0A117MPT1_9ACTN|nr:GNAT family N-acetyltransferase [Actinoplanes awajinensis]KUL29094.1 acetyltransferase [Actinoplanes awajinensis subsp. mycoplanecinus]
MPSLVTPALTAGSLSGLVQPEIKGEGVLLRPWQEGDRDAVVAGFADPAIQRWHCRTMNEDEATAWILGWPRRWHDETDAGWAIVDCGGALGERADGGEALGEQASDDGALGERAGGGRVVGQVGLRRIDLAEGLASISYWVLPGFRGRRFAPRALGALTIWAFDVLGLHRLELSHSTANGASCRVAVQAGYLAEGIKRSEARHADGWHDMHQHARISTD